MDMQELIDMLHERKYSCVIASADGQVRCYTRRGVADLYALLGESPEILAGAAIADKVVGKGAAALMALGGVRRVYADVMSEPAATLLRKEGVSAEYGELVPHIINRAGTGICPVEQRCAGCDTPALCLREIEEFIKTQKTK